MLSPGEIKVRDSIDHLFRRHAGQMVLVLSRIFGFEHLDVIEDAVQDALVAAMKKWPFTGIPANPRAWLIEAAKNRVVDNLRRSVKSDELLDEAATANGIDTLFFGSEMPDDELRMIFACCHPAIAPDSQVALTLKIVGGFSVSEIAPAFLSNDEAVAKMISRAKGRLRKRQVALEMPVADQLNARIDAVLKALYLLFNEGYIASAGDELVRKDLCFEAIRLCSILASHPVTRLPRVHALLALFLFLGARLSARTGLSGELLLLADQDRSSWDQEMIASGLQHFRLSASGTRLSEYHLEAEIAAIYTLSPDYSSTDWARILECYERLQQRKFSPVIELNRIIVLSKLSGPQSALEQLNKLELGRELTNYSLFYVTKSHFLTQLDRLDEARTALTTAVELTNNEPVRRFLIKKLCALNDGLFA